MVICETFCGVDIGRDCGPVLEQCAGAAVLLFGVGTDKERGAATTTQIVVCSILFLVIAPRGVYFVTTWWAARPPARRTRALRLWLTGLSALPSMGVLVLLFGLPIIWLAVLCVPLGMLWAFVVIAFLCRVHNLDRHASIRIALALLSTTLLVLYLVKDEPARPLKYAGDDIPTPTNAIDSHAVFSQLAKDGIRIRLPLSSLVQGHHITNYAAQIEDAWHGSADIHATVAMLNTFVGPVHVKTNYWNYKPNPDPLLRGLVHIYIYYARLKAEQGAYDEAVDALVQMYAMARKHLRWGRTIIDKLVWFSAISASMQTAYEIAQHKDISDQALKKRQRAFTPFAPREVSMKWPLIGEFVISQDSMRNFAREFDSPLGIVLAPLMPLYLNLNTTINNLEQAIDKLLAAADRVPVSARTLTPRTHLRAWHIKNPLGRLFNKAFVSNTAKFPNWRDQFKERSDLLALYLGFRLRQPSVIWNYLAPGAYPVDEKTGLPFSPGVDGQTGTLDDVYLEKGKR